MTGSTVPVLVHGETLLLHPERAVIWPRRRTVIVADIHFGKSAHFGRHGIAVPAGADETDRERLRRLVTDADARRLVILGDLAHAPPVEGTFEAAELHGWAERLGEIVEVHVIAGNHDRGGTWIRPDALRWWDASSDDPPFRFVHDAARLASRVSDPLYSLSGHVHPVVRLRRAKTAAMRVPVFWQKANGLILPSFGSFTGGFAVSPTPGERVYAVGSGGVVPLT